MEVLGWKARLSLEDALRDAWRWQQRLTPRIDS
jgi:UDP-glucose 4-epimerase